MLPPVAHLLSASFVALFAARCFAGHCKFGEACKFDHPVHYSVRLSREGLPLRPGQPPCMFYERTGECKFGPSCKFDHPPKC